ncbi:hydroxymethylglutaryl-CoA synthase [Candidatus Peregrinibacteria bacterium]|jgi:hydroxymethylglutaryl-CoA synthase|nr:hydroxymethylglutaryl-CoA synthase [Candidatus Peregrinibacteria bacterium]MBT3598581.1 hydroxymethylglutaryl-CoA synthase [Candidatus Peregrinibacteria bacterium]MBT4586101.1 hydroxymethylglutaryl-CoA synthase [Candidatus Peregrinibacteria bacterium]MBT6730576.1 hydroxymethylglutaryl-CoA synthase [Candidatus Peregrinibacteria bacterium]MBT7009462.1 hydroxymethylglutaryl-CoA synthase [Candidatus Peregrinibacteria bacterium]
MNRSAIVGFGMYIPNQRIRTADIAAHWQQDSKAISAGIGVNEKSVPSSSEDAFTMAFEAGKQAIETADIASTQISACYIGSESHPYAVKPTSGMVAAALELDPFCFCADLEFACKAGTAGMQIVDSMVKSKQVRYGLAIGSDTAQSAPGDALEYTAAAGAAAFVIGSEKDEKAICRMDYTLSFTTDTPDFWRPAEKKYPSHAGRFTGEPSYFRHVREAIKGIIQTADCSVEDINHVVLHMPNAKFPKKIAKEFGFTKEQMEHGFIVPNIGNTYSACSPLGLAHVLQKAKKQETILLISYGSGAGSDAFLFTMLKDGSALPQDEREKQYLTYGEYMHCQTQ